MRRFASSSAAAILALLLLPAAAYAQAAITGVVKDASAASCLASPSKPRARR